MSGADDYFELRKRDRSSQSQGFSDDDDGQSEDYEDDEEQRY